jgi:predicted membrane channel-forming protein YqfA (hemolysin III family)
MHLVDQGVVVVLMVEVHDHSISRMQLASEWGRVALLFFVGLLICCLSSHWYTLTKETNHVTTRTTPKRLPARMAA